MSNKRLAQVAVGTGAGTLVYTCPTGYLCDLKDMMIANTTTGSINFTLHLVPSGGSPATSNMLFPTVAIAANTVVQWEGLQSLKAGDFMQAIGSVAGITLTLNGEEIRAGS